MGLLESQLSVEFSVASSKISTHFPAISEFCISQISAEKRVISQLTEKIPTNSLQSVKPHPDSLAVPLTLTPNSGDYPFVNREPCA